MVLRALSHMLVPYLILITCCSVISYIWFMCITPSTFWLWPSVLGDHTHAKGQGQVTWFKSYSGNKWTDGGMDRADCTTCLANAVGNNDFVQLLHTVEWCYLNEHCRQSSTSTTQFVDLHVVQMLMFVLIPPFSLHSVTKVIELVTYQ